MYTKDDELISLTDEQVEGFYIVDSPDGYAISAPAKPTVRCARCGCWLRISREDKPRRNGADSKNEREYCSACEEHILRHSKLCALCKAVFFSEDGDATRCAECEADFQRNKRTCAVCGKDFLPYVCAICKGEQKIYTVCHACHWQEKHEKEAAVHERVCRVCGCRFLPRTCIVPECKEKLTDICTVCHEEEAHMGMTATVWTLPDCLKCEAVLGALKRLRRKVTRLSLERLSSGEEPDVDAMAHLAMTGGSAPLVFVDGRFLEPDEISNLIAREAES